MLDQYNKEKIDRMHKTGNNVESSIFSHSYIPSINMVSIKENVIDDQNNEQIDETNKKKLN